MLADQERPVVEHLITYGSPARWLGYLDTDAHEIVLPAAKKVQRYANWPFVIANGGPRQAMEWSDTLPN